MMTVLQKTGRRMARYLSKPRPHTARFATSPPEMLEKSLRPGDVLLVDSNSRFGMVIKYLTQSSWSHAALYAGNLMDPLDHEGEKPTLIEADVNDGVRVVPLSRYSRYHTRICRPVGLSEQEIQRVIRYAADRLGQRYDLRNIVDLARYLMPIFPVPGRWRRQMLALGSGDPTRAICSSLIAQAFQSIQYPILPKLVSPESDPLAWNEQRRETFQIRHHSLFTPRDFDVSPYFQVIKPAIESGFNPHEIEWYLSPLSESG